MSDIAGRIFPIPPALRYVVLRHDGIDDPHFDLTFETSSGPALATWRSPQWPIERETMLTGAAYWSSRRVAVGPSTTGASSAGPLRSRGSEKAAALIRRRLVRTTPTV